MHFISVYICFLLFSVYSLGFDLINTESNDRSIQEFDSLVICKEVCVKLEDCLTNRWLVCSWNRFGTNADTVCCLNGNNDNAIDSDKTMALNKFCEYQYRRSQSGISNSFSFIQRITFGWNANIVRFPWMASVFMFGQFLCGAAIVGDQYLVTAAHCFAPLFDVSVYSVKVGSNSLDSGQEYIIEKIVRHELFFSSEAYHDIAVVVTKETFDFSLKVKHICLPREKITEEELIGLTATVVGFGKTLYNGFFSSELKQTEVNIISNRECDRKYENIGGHRLAIGIQECMICAGSQSGGHDACQGDSGGPLTVAINGIDLLIGIVSFGHKCGTNAFPGVYTNILYYRKWIFDVMSKHDRYIT